MTEVTPLSRLEKFRALVARGPATHVDFRGHCGLQDGAIFSLAEDPPSELFQSFFADIQRTAEKGHKSRERALEILEDRAERATASEIDLLTKGAEALYQPSGRCGHCGEEFTLKTREASFVASTACCCPGGIKPYCVEVNVPSGRLVFANDLRPLAMVDDRFITGSLRGRMLTTQAYAVQGIAHIFCGNTNPLVFETREGFDIVEVKIYESDDEEIYSELIRTLGTPRVRIETKLWWYSAMDEGLFRERCAETGLDPQSFDPFVIAVPAGVYSFEDMLPDRSSETHTCFSRIRKSPAEAPALDTLNRGNATCLEESQMWEVINHFYPSRLYPSRNAVLLDVLTVLGNGFSWHNGQLMYVDRHPEDAPLRPEPCLVIAPRDASHVPPLPGFTLPLEGPADFYETTFEDAQLLKAPLDADPYWLATAMMFLKSALAMEITYAGPSDRTAEQAIEVQKQQRQIMIAALDLFCEIAERRGLDKDGTLDRIFAQISAAWTR